MSFGKNILNRRGNARLCFYAECHSTPKLIRLTQTQPGDCIPAYTANAPETYFSSHISQIPIDKSILGVSTNYDLSFTQSKAICTHYIEVAEPSVSKISRELQKHISKKKEIYFINPGKGSLTQALIDDGVKNLRLIESRKLGYNFLEKSFQNNPQWKTAITSISNFNFFDLKHTHSFTAHKKEFWNNKDAIYNKISTKDFNDSWQREPKVEVVGIIPWRYEAGFMHNAILQLQHNNADSLYSHGRIQFLFYVSGKEATYMKTGVGYPPYKTFWYNYASVAYKLFYDIQFLATQPLTDFKPDLTPHVNLLKSPKFDNTRVHLVKVVPKPNLYREWGDHRKIGTFLAFIRHLMRKPSATIASHIQRWPNLKPSLVNSDKKINELRPEEMVSLFKSLSKCPEYTNYLTTLTGQASFGYNRIEFDKIRDSI